MHIFFFTLFFVGGAIFAALALQFTTQVEFATALERVARRIGNSVAFRQLIAILAAILLMRFGVHAVMQHVARLSASTTPWEKTTMFKARSVAIERACLCNGSGGAVAC